MYVLRSLIINIMMATMTLSRPSYGELSKCQWCRSSSFSEAD